MLPSELNLRHFVKKISPKSLNPLEITNQLIIFLLLYFYEPFYDSQSANKLN